MFTYFSFEFYEIRLFCLLDECATTTTTTTTMSPHPTIHLHRLNIHTRIMYLIYRSVSIHHQTSICMHQSQWNAQTIDDVTILRILFTSHANTLKIKLSSYIAVHRTLVAALRFSLDNVEYQAIVVMYFHFDFYFSGYSKIAKTFAQTLAPMYNRHSENNR